MTSLKYALVLLFCFLLNCTTLAVPIRALGPRGERIPLPASTSFERINQSSVWMVWFGLPVNIADYEANSIDFHDQPNGTASAIGSGTYYIYGNKYYIITAAHMLQPTNIYGEYYACHMDFSEYTEGAGVHCSELDFQNASTYNDRDIAIVPLFDPIPNMRSARIAFDYNWTLGEHISIFGFPHGMPGPSEGIIQWGLDPSTVTADVRAWWGSSGGGVWNDDGELIGVIYAIRLSNHMRMLFPTWPAAIPVEGQKMFTLIPSDLIAFLDTLQ